jgi:DNA repair protein RadC
MEQIANQTVSEINVVYKNKQRASDRPLITTSSDAYKVLLTGFNPDTIGIQEQFVVAYLNRSNRVLGLYRLATGGVCGVVSDPRLILGVAIKLVASSLILCHNHPSGSLKPSRADEDMTYKIKEGAKLFDIKVLDHLIVAPDGENYFSFADEGFV